MSANELIDLTPDTDDDSVADSGRAFVCGGKPAGRPRASDLEARMENLTATAAALFLEKGYSKVSLEMIAREAHVAVRTIYVKFGGKAGLFNAIIAKRRTAFFAHIGDMDTDTRPIAEILGDFGMRFLELVTSPHAISMQRMVVAEAETSPELAKTFYDAGPALTREKLRRFFARPDIRAQLRDDVEIELLPTHLANCILGDQFRLFLFKQDHVPTEDEMRQGLNRRLNLFLHAVLRKP